jgi:hypothetical protein
MVTELSTTMKTLLDCILSDNKIYSDMIFFLLKG